MTTGHHLLSPGSPLADILERNRARYNQMFLLAAHSAGCPIEPDDLAAHLAGPLRVLAEAVHATDATRVEPAVDALYGVSLELLAKGCLGSQPRTPLVGRVWTQLLPLSVGALAEEPRAVAAGLSNAAVNAATESPAAGAAWLTDMLRIAPACARAEDLLRAAAVVAWRSGLPHYRASALDTWRALPDALRYRTLGLAADEGLPLHELDALLADPWYRPGARRIPEPTFSLVGITGGFRGFGGAFTEPPLLATDGETLYAYDAGSCWLVAADTFGVLLRPARQPPTDLAGSAGDFTLEANGTIRCGHHRTVIKELAGAQSHASTPSMLAVTLPHSHHIYLVALLHYKVTKE